MRIGFGGKSWSSKCFENRGFESAGTTLRFSELLGNE